MTAKKASNRRRQAPVDDLPAQVLIWVIDDGLSNLQRVERTFNYIAAPEIVLENWEDGLKAAGVFERRLELGDVSGIPQIVFMDYFLGGDLTGYEITRQMLASFAERPAGLKRVARPIIIGHSSVPDCSAQIVSLSQDFALEKKGGNEFSPAILDAFNTAHKRAHLLANRVPLGWKRNDQTNPRGG